MIGIAIGVFFIIQAIVLIFVLALCRSAAMADRQYERVRMIDQRHWVN
jgi:hypothetical protein